MRRASASARTLRDLGPGSFEVDHRQALHRRAFVGVGEPDPAAPRAELPDQHTGPRGAATLPAMSSATPSNPSRGAPYIDLIRWDRPAVWLLLLWPTLSALWIAADGWPG